jgi:hypothetical protein
VLVFASFLPFACHQEVDLDSRPPPPVKPISGFRTEFGSDKAWDANPEDLYEPNKHMPYFKKHFETQGMGSLRNPDLPLVHFVCVFVGITFIELGDAATQCAS